MSEIEKINLDEIVREIGDWRDIMQLWKIVLPQCDLAAIYDNTENFRRFAIYKDGKCVRISRRVPKWYWSILNDLPN